MSDMKVYTIDVILALMIFINLFPISHFPSIRNANKKGLDSSKRGVILWTDAIMWVGVLVCLVFIIFYLVTKVLTISFVFSLITYSAISLAVFNLIGEIKYINRLFRDEKDEINDGSLQWFLYCSFVVLWLSITMSLSNLVSLINQNHLCETTSFLITTAIVLIYGFVKAFVFFANLIGVLKKLYSLLKSFRNGLREKVLKTDEFLLKKWNGSLPKDAKLTNKLVRKLTMTINFFVRIIGYFVILPLLFMDIIIGTIETILLSIVMYAVYPFIALVIRLFEYSMIILEKISSLSRKMNIINSFRLSGIFSIVFLVCYFRLFYPYEIGENYLMVLEFVASSVVIPIVLEWIYTNSLSKRKV